MLEFISQKKYPIEIFISAQQQLQFLFADFPRSTKARRLAGAPSCDRDSSARRMTGQSKTLKRFRTGKLPCASKALYNVKEMQL